MTVRVSADFRTLNVGTGDRVLGCVGDAGVRRVPFLVPRTVDGTDMAGWRVRVHYIDASGVGDRHEAADVEAQDDRLLFTWTPRPHAFDKAGTVTAAVEVAEVAEDGATVLREFNTEPACFTVKETVETDPYGPRLVDDEGHYIVLSVEEGD